MVIVAGHRFIFNIFGMCDVRVEHDDYHEQPCGTNYKEQRQRIYIQQDDDTRIETCSSTTTVRVEPKKKQPCLPKSRSGRYHSCPSNKDDTLNVKSTAGISNPMNHHLQNLFLNQKLCDLVISVDGKQFSLHKIALTSHSKKYLNLFVDPTQAPNTEIRLEGVPPDAVAKVIEYLYTYVLEINDDNVDSIVNICRQLDLDNLQEKCMEYLSNFDEFNVLSFLITSRRYGFTTLIKQMQDFISEEIDVLWQNSTFLLLDFEDVIAILGSKAAHSCVKSEKKLLAVGASWLRERDAVERQPFAARILNQVNLEKISPKVIEEQVRSFPAFLEISECVCLLRSAFRYHALQNWNRQRKYFAVPRRSFDKTVHDTNSVFIGDDGNETILVIGGVKYDQDPFEAGVQVLKYSFGSAPIWKGMPPLTKRRSGHQALLVGGHVYVLGGHIQTPPLVIPKPTNSVVRYEESLENWSEVAPMMVKRVHFAACSIDDNCIYVFGGEIEDIGPTDVCECYSVADDQWSLIPPLSIARSGLSACAHKGLIYVAGGLLEKSVLDLVDCYDVSKKKWSTKSSLPVGLCYGTLVDTGGCMLYVGGAQVEDQGLQSEGLIFAYDGDKDTWIEMTQLPSSRHFICTAVLGTKVCLIGGFSSDTWEYLSDSLCFYCKSFLVDSSTIPPLPFGLAKAAAVGIVSKTA